MPPRFRRRFGRTGRAGCWIFRRIASCSPSQSRPRASCPPIAGSIFRRVASRACALRRASASIRRQGRPVRFAASARRPSSRSDWSCAAADCRRDQKKNWPGHCTGRRDAESRLPSSGSLSSAAGVACASLSAPAAFGWKPTGERLKYPRVTPPRYLMPSSPSLLRTGGHDGETVATVNSLQN